MGAARWLKVSLTTSALVVASPALGLAQGVTVEQLAQECLGDSLALRGADRLGAALHRRTPDETWKRMVLAQAGLEFRALGDTVRALWDTLSRGIDTTVARRMAILLERQRGELAKLDTNRAFLRDSGMTAIWFEIDQGDPGQPWLINSAEQDPGNPANDRAVRLVPGQTTLATARAVCWTALLARTVADSGSQQARTTTLAVLAQRGRRWENYERYGYSLTPLELLLNGWCGFCRKMLEPPRIQLIAVHVLPTYAVRDRLGNRTALTTEIAGVLFYNASRSFHVGFSYAYALPAEERREAGWVLHVSRIGQVGLSFRNDTYTRANASLLLSADLYRFIENWSGKLRDERDAIAKGIQKLRAGLE